MLYAEIRFAPQLHTKKGLTQDQVVKAAILGLQEALAGSFFKAKLILCCMRGTDNLEENLLTVRTAAAYLGRGVAAVDLAGAEALYPTEDYEKVFALARELSVPFTIHAGEADGAESVWAALRMGACRIGMACVPEKTQSFWQSFGNGIFLWKCVPAATYRQRPFRLFQSIRCSSICGRDWR